MTPKARKGLLQRNPYLGWTTLLGVCFCVWMGLALFLIRSGALTSGSAGLRLALGIDVALLAVAVWLITGVISKDVVHLATRDIVAAIPLIVSLSLGAFLFLFQFGEEPLLLTGAFFVVLLTTQISASCRDRWPQYPVVAPAASFLVGLLILLIPQLHSRPPTLFYWLTAVMVWVVAAFESVKHLFMTAAARKQAASQVSTTTLRLGRQAGRAEESTQIAIGNIVSCTFIMGVKANMGIYLAFLVFYACLFKLAPTDPALASTMQAFYAAAVQVQGILLGVVSGFATLALQQGSRGGRTARARSLLSFVGMYILMLLLFLAGMLLSRATPMEALRSPLEAGASRSGLFTLNLLVFEVACLAIPPSLIYLHGLVSAFLPGAEAATGND